MEYKLEGENWECQQSRRSRRPTLATLNFPPFSCAGALSLSLSLVLGVLALLRLVHSKLNISYTTRFFFFLFTRKAQLTYHKLNRHFVVVVVGERFLLFWVLCSPHVKSSLQFCLETIVLSKVCSLFKNLLNPFLLFVFYSNCILIYICNGFFLLMQTDNAF